MSSVMDVDGVVKRVALCSAIAAGFGYVGYSVIKSTLCGIQEENEDQGNVDCHLILNSRGSQTDICFKKNVAVGPEELSCVITPLKSVQERVRELNLQAKLFPHDAVLNDNRTIGNALLKSRSTQNTPWSSPRIVSPSVHSSMSVDNLNQGFSYSSSPKLRRRSTRRKHASGGEGYSSSLANVSVLPLESEDSLLKKLDGLFCRNRVITPNEAKSLVILLYSKSEDVLIKIVNTISNCSAFSVNQDFFREAGCIARLTGMLNTVSVSLLISIIQALGNLSVNEENQKEIKDCLLSISDIFENRNNTELLRQTSVALLTNMAVTSIYHEEYYSPHLIKSLLSEIDIGSDRLRLMSLKLLVNLSCNEFMIPYILASEAPKNLLRLLSDKVTDEDLLLRLITFVSNIVVCKVNHELEVCDLPPENKAASPEMIYTVLFGHSTFEKVVNKCINLSSHSNMEIQEHSLRILESLNTDAHI